MTKHKVYGLLTVVSLGLALKSGLGFALPQDHPKTDWLGAAECGECHKKEVEIWRRTPHYESFKKMPRSSEAKSMTGKLNIRRIKTSKDCQVCHFTSVMKGERYRAVSGTSCESCHGPAKHWINLHSDYGGKGKKASDETQAHKQKRLSASVKKGLIRPVDLYNSFAVCYQCHTVPNEKVVNVGGHGSGADFEVVAYSSGIVRHNVWFTEGKSNPYDSPGRTRMKYILGVMLNLEYSLRALAEATQSGPYVNNLVKRIHGAQKQLKLIQDRVHLKQAAKILEVLNRVELKPAHKAPLLKAAEAIRSQGKSFAQSDFGAGLSSVDSLLPRRSDYK